MSGAGAQAHQFASADPGLEEEQPLYRLEQHKASPIKVNVQVNGVPVSMELDTGAVVSVMSQQQQNELFPTAQLQPSKSSYAHTQHRVWVWWEPYLSR